MPKRHQKRYILEVLLQWANRLETTLPLLQPPHILVIRQVGLVMRVFSEFYNLI